MLANNKVRLWIGATVALSASVAAVIYSHQSAVPQKPITSRFYPPIGKKSTVATLPLPFPPSRYSLESLHTYSDEELAYLASDNSENRYLLRARNLLTSHHYAEAEEEYRKGIEHYESPPILRKDEDPRQELALTYILQNKPDKALLLIQEQNFGMLHAELLYRQKKFAELSGLADPYIRETNGPFALGGNATDELVWWLRVKACASYAMQDKVKARDLLIQAVKSDICDSGKVTTECIAQINAINAVLEKPDKVSLSDFAMPAADKQAILDHLRDFIQTNLQSNGSNSAERIEIYPQNCAITRDEVMHLMPPRGELKPVKNASSEEWKYPAGTFFLSFTESGYKLLERCSFVSGTELIIGSINPRSIIDGPCENPDLVLLLIDREMAKSKDSVYLLVSRARVLTQLGRHGEAIQAAQNAVKIGGRYYLAELAKREALAGKTDDAINHLKAFLGNHASSPETARYETRLAALYLKKQNYREALRLVSQALANGSPSADGLFVRAQANVELGDNSTACADAAKAENLFYNNCNIIKRDEVRKWRTHQHCSLENAR